MKYHKTTKSIAKDAISFGASIFLFLMGAAINSVVEPANKSNKKR